MSRMSTAFSRFGALLTLLALAGCAAPGAEVEPAPPAVQSHHETRLLYASELQSPTLAAGLPSEGDSCLLVEGVQPSTLVNASVEFRWHSDPTNREALRVGAHLGDETGRVEDLGTKQGPPPLRLEIPGVRLELEHSLVVFVGAPPGMDAAVNQPVFADFAFWYHGEIRTYSLSCTVAG